MVHFKLHKESAMIHELMKVQVYVDRLVGQPLTWLFYGLWMGCRWLKNATLTAIAKSREWWAQRKARREMIRS
jgi:hypothetical protein